MCVKSRFSHNKTFLLFLLPSLAGLLVFYIIPFFSSFYYAVTDTVGGFTGLANFSSTLGSSSFLRAVGNTVFFMLICVPLNMIVPFLIASMLNKRPRHKNLFSLFFMLPLVIPSGATVYFWRVIFGENGVANSLLLNIGQAPLNWFQSPSAFAVIIVAFLFKNIGFNMVLFLAGLEYIPKDYYESASVEGAGRFTMLRKITLVYLMPTSFLVFLMSIINSFKIFREIFLLFGNYPNESIYMLQHYMNNQFFSASLQKLSSAATLISAAIAVVVLLLFRAQKKASDNF